MQEVSRVIASAGILGIALGFGQFNQAERIGNIAFQALYAINLFGKPPTFAHDAPRFIGIVPKRRVFDPRVQFFKTTDRGIPVKDASSAGPPMR
jgi:hypothetical protein